MATSNTLGSMETVVVLNQPDGIALIPKPTALTRLNYYDGKFLRAADMQAEQLYGMRLQQLSSQAGGAGVVDGFDLATLAGDQLQLGAGLAIDDEGRVLFMPQDSAVNIEELIRRSRALSAVVAASGAKGSEVFALCEAVGDAPNTSPIAGVSLYVVGIGRAEALCGQEDVFGKLCEEACVSGTERPWRLEGVVLRALPLVLSTPLPTSTAVQLEQLHLRSRVASSYFADEARQIEHLISGAGLQSAIWCAGARATTGGFVPLGVIARAGGHTVFLDDWTARRERVDSHPRRYWQWRMMMRPWDVYLSHILQFQCQLRDVWRTTPPTGDDPCDKLRRTVLEVSDLVSQLENQYRQSTELQARQTSDRLAGMLASNAIKDKPAGADIMAAGTPLSRTLIDGMVRSIQKVKGSFTVLPADQVLIRRGIIELPSAGYLPVAPGSAITVNDQVRALLGEGVELRFCVVRPDFVAHALEEAQHMERISLLRGLDNAQNKEQVDILVPDGEISDANTISGVGWEVRLTQAASDVGVRLAMQAGAPVAGTQPYARDVMTGAARSEVRADASMAFVFAGLVETASQDDALKQLQKWAGERDNGFEQTLWQSVDLMSAAPAKAKQAEADPATLAQNFTMLRKEAVSYRLKTLERVASSGAASGIRHFPGLKVGGDSDHAAMWLALRVQANPLTVVEGGRVDMSMDFSLLMPKAAGTIFIDVSIVGAQLSIDSRVTTGRRTAVQGTLRGAAIISGLVGTLADAQRGIPFNVPVILSSEPSTQGMALGVEADFSATLFDGRGVAGLEAINVRVLSNDAQQTTNVIVALRGGKTQIGYVAALRRNDGVLTLGHPLRTASETALDLLATRESSPDFASAAAADLFGARPAAQDALTIHAKRDWVLFHRRRNKQCGAGPSTQPLEERRYQLYHLRVKTAEQLRSARAAVLSANADRMTKLGFSPFGAASFDGGRSQLATPTAPLLADWDAAQPGNRIRLGAIGSQGAAQAEGDALAKARLSSLELTLARASLDAAVDNQVLPVLPELSFAGWDGAVFLVTLDVQAVCHDVYRVHGQEAFGRFMELATQNGVAAAIGELKLQALAHVDFQDDAKTLQLESLLKLREAWGTVGKPPDGAVGFYLGTKVDAAEAAAITSQSQAIMGALQGNVSDVFVRNTPDLDKATACRGVTVLVEPAEPQVAQILLASANYDGRFIVSANTKVELAKLTDGVPDDEAGLLEIVRGLLAKKPLSLGVGVKTNPELPQATSVLQLIMLMVKKLGYTNLAQTDTFVLQQAEIADLEKLGLKPESYGAAVLFSGKRPPL